MIFRRLANSYDWQLGFVCLGLLLIGLTAQYSISASIGNTNFSRQLFFAGVGVLIFALLLLVPLRKWLIFAVWCLTGMIILLAFTLVWGRESGSAKRWLPLLFFDLQVSEFFKIVVLLCLARWASMIVSQKGVGIRHNLQIIGLVPCCLLLIGLVLVCNQPDFGTFFQLSVVILAIVFLSGLSWRWIVGSLILGGLGTYYLIVTEPYRLRRVTIFLDPLADPFVTGYHQMHSLMAFMHGGLFGQGLGHSAGKFGWLPAAHNDFIIAVIAAETGFIGFIGVSLMFFFLLKRVFGIALQARERGELFGTFYAFGLFTALVIQIIVNIGNNLSSFPVKGFTLPLISYGGSSLLATFIMLALLFRLDYENRQVERKFYVRRL